MENERLHDELKKKDFENQQLYNENHHIQKEMEQLRQELFIMKDKQLIENSSIEIEMRAYA